MSRVFRSPASLNRVKLAVWTSIQESFGEGSAQAGAVEKMTASTAARRVRLFIAGYRVTLLNPLAADPPARSPAPARRRRTSAPVSRTAGPAIRRDGRAGAGC